MTRAAFLRAIGAGLAVRPRRPNVLFIAVDDLRPELGVYGAGHVKSPHIDALGRSGTVFTRAYCQQALCNPSRASMLTGLRPDTLRVWNLQTDFRTTRPEAVTLPQRLKQNGYHSVNVGKLFHNIFPDPVSYSEPDLRIPGYPFDPDAVYRSASEVAAIEARKKQITAAGNQARYIDQYGEWYLKNNATEAPDVPDNAYFDGAQTDAAIAKLAALQKAGLSVSLDLRNEKINRKIVDHIDQRVPVLAVVGRKEAEEGTLVLRRLPGREQETVPLAEAVARLAAEAAAPDRRG